MIPGTVTVAYVHPDVVSESFQQSLMQMIGNDVSTGGRIARGGWLAIRCYGGDALPQARNEAVANFLSGPGEWLLWIDSDMGFESDTLNSLLAVADPKERPIVGALCFAYKNNEQDGMGGWRANVVPTIFDWRPYEHGVGFVSVSGYPVNTIVRCAGTGSACVLIHRSVLERIRTTMGEVWYDRIPNEQANGALISEDLSFCLRAGAQGFPCHVHTGVRTTHHKPIWVGETDYWAQWNPPPATECVDVIVPVMHRPQNAKPFMESLRASTGLATVWAVADVSDTKTREAWNYEGAGIIDYGSGKELGTFAEKVNHASRWLEGYHDTSVAPWMFITGDDVRFHAGWLDHAQTVAGTEFDVIGTNDLGNQRTLAGEHSPHLLIRSSYVDEVGASWDAPGVVCHEGYRHCFVDDEIVTAAKQRGKWAMAMGSIVEHLHPAWGKGKLDKTYRIGQSHMDEDRETFKARLKENLDADQTG